MGYHKITAETAKNMMDSQKDIIILDVRRKDEYDVSHIKGALLIPNETINLNEPVQLKDKNATILVYCRSGVRSMETAYKLVDMGYHNVYDFGGIIHWNYGVVSIKE